MSRPSISLFLPAWNEEDYVERAVSRAITVLERLTDDFEVLVINDASTDRTKELAEAISARDPRVRCITHETNQ
jgi:glycosyltransferase involved in cell wall biosynthesis